MSDRQIGPDIRECTSADFEQIFCLLQQLWPDKQLRQERLKAVYEAGLASDYQYYLCAVEHGCVKGFGSMTLKNNLWSGGLLAHVDELVVDHASRGRGVGSALLQTMIARALEQRCTRVELDSAFHRKGAHRFYESQGFENRAYLFSKVLA